MTDLFESLAQEAADLSSAPSDEQVARLRRKCEELVAQTQYVADLEKTLEEAKEKKNALAHKELPEIFDLLGVDQFGLPSAGEFGVDLTLSPYFKASIPADWEDEKKEAAFDHLEEIGGGDIIKTEVKFSLGRGETDKARAIAAFVEENFPDEAPTASITMGVPWNSLTSFVKERHNREGSPEFERSQQEKSVRGEKLETYMDLSVLNAVAGQVVKIKPRKEKK